jgi:hypothetical protein
MLVRAHYPILGTSRRKTPRTRYLSESLTHLSRKYPEPGTSPVPVPVRERSEPPVPVSVRERSEPPVTVPVSSPAADS